MKKADVLKILKDYDKEGKGKITFQDFNEISKLARQCGYLLLSVFVLYTLCDSTKDNLEMIYMYIRLLREVVLFSEVLSVYGNYRGGWCFGSHVL